MFYNCDEPVHADLGLKTLRNRRHFCKINWYCKVMSMKDERLPFELLTNEWDKVKCKGQPKRSWLAQVEFLKKELGLQDQVSGIKLIEKSP